MCTFRQMIQYPADMHNADDVVQSFPVHRQARMVAYCDLASYFIGRRSDVDSLNLMTRRHCVLHGNRFEIEEIQQDVLMFLRQEIAPFENKSAQFLHRKCMWLV